MSNGIEPRAKSIEKKTYAPYPLHYAKKKEKKSCSKII